jgi:predicted ATPase/DNA-binding SARP family transcriptional activator
MAHLKVYLLGAPRFSLDGEPLALGRRKVIGLLAYLAVTAQAHSRDYLAGLFWPDYDSSGARANLRRDISRLRAEVGEDTLLTEGDQVQLNPQAQVWLDVAEFSRRVSQVKQHGHTLHPNSPPLCEDCARLLREAVDLYEGDFMSGFSLLDSAPYDEWQFFESETLRSRLAEALQHLIHWSTQAGDLPQAVTYNRRWLALDALHEPAHRQLMLLYAWSGQQAAAVRQYKELSRLLKRELGVSPDPETERVYQAVQGRELGLPDAAETRHLSPPEVSTAPAESQASAKPKHNLPVPATPFVGRQAETRSLLDLLDKNSPVRLITLLGPGGSGKTRLGIQVASQLLTHAAADFRDGAWFVALAPLSDPAFILPVIAQVMGFTIAVQEDPRQVLLDLFASKQMLLVLDNFEHLISPESQQFLADLLGRAPQLKVLVTSRTRLNVRGETLFPVEGLPVPEENQSLDTAPSVQAFAALELFQESAIRVKPDFVLNDHLEAVVDICRLLQGMPLGIELAAAWLELLSPPEIENEIKRSLDFLETDWVDMPERQRSLRAVFNSSWMLLDEAERRVVPGLSIFQGSFTRQAAEAVTGASLKVLLGLVHKSWLQRTPDDRFAIHELLRQYAYDKLDSTPGGLNRARTRHATYYADFATAQNQAMNGLTQKEAFATLRAEFENVRAAWNWMVVRGQYELLVFWTLPAVFRFCEARARGMELLAMLDQLSKSLLAAESDSPVEKRLLCIVRTAQGAFYINSYPVRFEAFGMVVPANDAALVEAWELAEAAEGDLVNGFWWVLLGYLYGRMINLEKGRRYLENLVARFREAKRAWELAFALALLGQLYELHLEGEPDWAATDRCLTEALEIFTRLGDEREAGNVQRSLGNLRRFEKAYPQAIECWTNAQKRLESAGDWAVANDIHWQIGDLLLDLGEFQQAFDHYRAMSTTYAKRGYEGYAGRLLSKESYEALRYGDLPRAWETRLLSLEYCRRAGDRFGEAWCLWELGEVHRVSGDAQAARAAFEQARVMFDEVGDITGYTFYYRGLGYLALQAGDYASALEAFQASLDDTENVTNLWAQAYAQVGLAQTLLAMGDVAGAGEQLREAYPMALRVTHVGLVLFALAVKSRWFAAHGDVELAAQAAEFVLGNPASWFEARQQAQDVLDELALNNPAALLEAARQRAAQMTLADFEIP